jgi:nitroreductase
METMRGSDVRTADHPVDALFIDRWSPRAMSGEPIADADLRVLFEAARWAPSAGNSQPWRMLYARRDTAHWPLFFDLLTERNRLWCINAAALVVFASRTISDQGRPLATHSYDTGAAWENFALQGALEGFVVHGMQGFDYARARTALRIPDDCRVEAMAAVGRPGPLSALDESFRARETPSGRKPLAEFVCEGAFSL